MLLNLLMSICCVAVYDDTLDVATVSSYKDADAVSLSPVRAMSHDMIKYIGAHDLYEVLEQFSGVSIRDYGGIGGLKTVSVRNMGASHTSVIYDGIPISDAQNGQVDISRFNLHDVSSVSVAFGVSDEIFCSARHLASAGVLQIESAKADFSQKPMQFTAGMTGSTIGAFAPYASVRCRLGKNWVMKLSADGMFSKGNYPFKLRNGDLVTTEKRVNSDVASVGAEADLCADWGNRGMLRLKLNCHDSERGLPGSVILYTQNPFERLWDKSVISNVMYDVWNGGQWKFHTDIGYSRSFNRHLDCDPVYPQPLDSRYIQNEYSISSRIMFGVRQKWRFALAEDCYVNTLDSDIPECPFPCRLTSVTALSCQYSGRRLRANAFLTGMMMTEKLKNANKLVHRFNLSPMVGLNWNFIRDYHLRASYKKGFRMPTFNDLYYSRVGNDALKPETAHQFNLGLTGIEDHGWGRISMTMDAYCNLVKDKIIAVPTMFIWKMRNVSEVVMYGSDINLSGIFELAKWLRMQVSANWSLQYAVDVTDPHSKSYGSQIPYTPRHCGSGSLILETRWANLSYRVSAVGRRYTKSQILPSTMLEGFADHCICLSRSFNFGRRHVYRVDFSLEGQNLAGTNHELVQGYPMPGRSLRIRVGFNY